MYQIFLLCVISVVVYGNSDDTKYIDLLPEAEKEEFLNRIARRIIEEIQSKDSPEQSHTEVSDDQLNAHHAYVQDLIKEESENLRNERRSYNVTGNVKRESNKDEFETDTPRIVDNNQHIDLTLRNNTHKNKLSDDSYDVIPVKVVYDQEGSESTQSPTTISGPPDTTSSLEQKDNINNNNSKFSNSFTANAPSVLSNATEEKETNNQTNTESTYSDLRVSEDHSDVMSNKDIQIFITDKQNVTNNSVESSTQILHPTSSDTTSTKENNNNYDSFENKESSTQIYVSSNKNKKTEANSPTESDVELSYIYTTLMPLTTEKYTKYNLSTQSTVVYVTAVQSTTGNSDIKSKINGVNKLQNVEETGEVKIKNDIKSNVPKKLLRTRLEILSQEYNYDGQASHENDDKRNKQKQFKNKTPKQYFVYEVPPEKPVFVEVEKKKQNEQPYVIPIYNFAPENAYYNAYNNFGINNDEEDEVIKKQALEDNEDSFDEELFLRSGFEIDLDSKNSNHPNNKKRQNGYWMKHPRHSHWEHVLQSKLEYNPYLIDNENNEYLGRKSIRGNNLRQSGGNSNGKNNKFPDLSKIPDEITYEPLRKYNENNYDDKEAKQKKLNKKQVRYTFTSPGDNDHVRAVKKFLYQHKLLNPSPTQFHYHIRPHQRVLNENNDLKLKNTKKHHKITKNNIELDYYFGEHDRADTVSNQDYLDSDDVAGHQNFYDENKKNRKVDMKSSRMEAKNDCEYGCIEINLKPINDNFDNYLETLIKVLRDMIYRDKVDLINYDWVLSTVDLKSALKKLVDLTENIEKGNKIHPLDLKLLIYIVYLYNTSSVKLENTIQSNQYSKAMLNINTIVNDFLSLLRRRIILPKSKKRKYGQKLSNHVNPWYKFHVRDGLDTRTLNIQELRSFKNFLNDLEDNLFELHNALKHIALITTYPKQNWYKDLKNIYLRSASKKQLLQVILHLAASRLFSSIEDTAKEAEEDEFNNKDGELLRRIQEEFIFVLRILERIKKI